MSNLLTDSNNPLENVGQYLSFSLDDEDYGVDILKVQEIRGWEGEAVREIPETPVYMKGVINLRGVVVPVFDLRSRLGRGNTDYTATTVIIVLKAQNDGEEYTIGLVVDAVSNVLDIEAGDIKQVRSANNRISTQYIIGMVERDKQMVMLLDSDKLFHAQDLDIGNHII